MSIDLEQALRSAFRDAAETVVPDPHPMRRLLQRRRRRWTGFGAFFAAIAVVAGAALVPALQLGATDRRGDAGYPITSGWARELLHSPTRGSLAGDTVLLGDIEREIQARAGERLDEHKVLFLGDVAGRRFVAYARYNATHAALYYNDGDPADSAARLVDGGYSNERLEPLVRLTSTTVPTLIGLVPAGCGFATSTSAAVVDNGEVTREWVDVPTGGWVARDSWRPAERWQVNCPAALWEGPAVPVGELTAADDPVAAGGLTHGAVVQRWSGPIEGTGRTWTLTTTLLSGGGAAAVLSSGSSGNFIVATDFAPEAWSAGDGPSPDRDGWGVMSTAISADPNVIAVRIPTQTGGRAFFTDKVLIVTTAPGAWSVRVPAEPGFLGTYLDNGIAVLNSEGGVISVNNVAETNIGYTRVVGRRDGPEYLGEPVASAW